jgi:uncharacterized protein YndB with AHSA1/START domain
MAPPDRKERHHDRTDRSHDRGRPEAPDHPDHPGLRRYTSQLYRAHADPELFARWVGPDGMNATIEHWDARSGGRWRYVASRDGVEFAFHGCFHEVSPDRLVQTFTYKGNPDEVARETLRFERLGDGHTRLRAQSLVDSFEGRDAWLANGMETGGDQGYAKLEGLIADGTL